MYDTMFHQLDPDGDVIFTLSKPEKTFAVWNTELDKCKFNQEIGGESAPEAKVLSQATSMDPDLHPLQQNADNNATASSDVVTADSNTSSMTKNNEHMQIQASSRAISLASRHFSMMFKREWKEGSTLRDGKQIEIKIEDWDPGMFLILMQVFHHQNRKVRRDLSLQELAKIAVLVDYYECHEAIELFSEIWISFARFFHTPPYSRELVLWILITWVFKKWEELKKALIRCVEETRGPIQTMGLPIPESVVNAVEDHRQKSLKTLIGSLQELIVTLRDDRTTCSFECRSILLGALTKEMHSCHLALPEATEPFLGYNVRETMRSISGIRSPKWCSNPAPLSNDESQSQPLSTGILNLSKVTSSTSSTFPPSSLDFLISPPETTAKIPFGESGSQKRQSRFTESKKSCSPHPCSLARWTNEIWVLVDVKIRNLHIEDLAPGAKSRATWSSPLPGPYGR